MTEINFYVSKEEGLEHRLEIAHRLVIMALKRNMQIHIHTDSEATSVKLDVFLWTKDSTSFIPHKIVSGEDVAASDPTQEQKKISNNTPNDISNDNEDQNKINEISISHDFEPLTDCDYLINLSNQRPAFFSRFSKVAEILDNNDELLTAGRKRYSFYRDRGYTLGYHQL